MILLTGATGFLGQRVARALVEKTDVKVRCLVRHNTPDNVLGSLSAGGGESNIELFKGSFNCLEDLEQALTGVDTVIHLAASKAGSVSVQVANNVIGTENLLTAVQSSEVKRFVLCSSLGVVKASTTPRGGLIDEESPIDDKPEQRDPYSHSKIVQEELAWQFYREKGLPLVVVRPSVIFGPGSELLSARIGMTVFGRFFHLGGSNEIPLTYVDNCAAAFVNAALKEGIEGEIFHITDDDLPKSKDILKQYRKAVKPVAALPFPYFLLRPAAWFNQWYSRRTHNHIPPVFTPYKVDTMWKGHTYSNAKAKQLLGWTPEISMRDALALTLKHEADQLG